MIQQVTASLFRLDRFVELSEYRGYDPYDTLNSPFNFKLFGKWGPAVAIQVQKRNPFNIRSLLGIKKGCNPKGMGLFLKSYSLLYHKTGDKRYLEKAHWLFNWLNTNHSKGYSGKCWGYNFDWANPGGNLSIYTPSVVVTSFVVDGIFEYFKLTGSGDAKEAINSAAKYITNDIPATELPDGIFFSYTHLSKGCCYNASLLAAEVLAKADHNTGEYNHQEIIHRAIDFVLAKQKDKGEWWYSYDPATGKERKQIDFHQGFVLVSLYNLNKLTGKFRADVEKAITRGLEFYKQELFFPNGRSLWRLPKKWPVDIHNQSQGIIAFALLSDYNPDYLEFAKTIARWTIDNMQDKSGYFYYRKYPLFTNKIAFVRWSQAWMILALAELLQNE
jgi:rhamnogalacturonyl hydrolase YesR